MARRSRTALGFMSGTSLDGIDAAFLTTDGEQIAAFGPSEYYEYSDHERDVLRAATQAALKWQFKGPRPDFSKAEDVIFQTHAAMLELLGTKYPEIMKTVTYVGFHGQTVLHHPATQTRKGQTLQIGEAERLKSAVSRFCRPAYIMHDFRSADVEAGGQGAPLAPIYHKALCEHAGLKGISAVLNLGGVGNVTLVGEGLLKASDTGPANGPLDQWMQTYGQSFDKGGAASLAGEVDFTRVERWLARDFFKRPLPRSADRYDFDVIDDVAGMTLENGAATLAAYCALSVKATLAQMNATPDRIILCGGGRHNKAIRLMLAQSCGAPVINAEGVGWDSDMIEAQAFAFLAARNYHNLPLSFPETTGVSKPTLGGGRVIRCC